MTDTIRIKRFRIAEYEIQEYIDVTQEEYDQIVAKTGIPLTDSDSVHYFVEYDRAIWEIVGDEWESEWTESGDERTVEIWISSEDE